MAYVVILGIPIPYINATVDMHFHHLVHEVVVAGSEHVERLLKQRDLLASCPLRNQDHEPGVDVELRVLFQKIPAIVGDDDVVVGDREADQIPVLPAGLAKMGDVVGLKASRLRSSHQPAAQAFVDQKAFLQLASAGSSMDRHCGP